MSPARRRRRLRRRLQGLLLLALLLALFSLCGRAAPLALGTFNIRTFPGEATDREAVARAIAELDADAFAVQEIVDPAAFLEVLDRASALTGRRYAAALVPATCLGHLPEPFHVGVVHDTRRLTRGAVHALGEDSCPEGQPAGMLAVLEDEDEARLVLASIHFSAGDGEARRARRALQWQWLLGALPELRARHGAPVIVAGDFNSTGFRRLEDPERQRIDRWIDEHALQLPTRDLECSMYWERERTLYDVSLLDHLVVPGELRVRDVEVLGMCAQLACEPQEAPPPAYEAVSDHCPVRLRIDR